MAALQPLCSLKKDEAGHVVRILAQLDGGGNVVDFRLEDYNHITYGYAATVHKVQGLTTDHSFVLVAGRGWDRHLTYVAKSRHRESCQLYADKNTHRDLTVLQKSLGRFGIKDSLLDFPWHFAQRRGLATPTLLERLQQHLKTKLHLLKGQLFGRYEAISRPYDYWTQKAQAGDTQLHDTFTHDQQRRENARLVADYVDGNRSLGQAFEQLRAHLQKVGLNQLDYHHPSFEFIQQAQPYRALQQATAARDKIASLIVKEPAKYQRALEIYGISLAQLEKQSLAHTYRERINQYQQECAQDRRVRRDQLAAHICANLKGHYGALKQAGIDSSQLQRHAEAHTRRLFLAKLAPDARTVFYVVERYNELVRKTAPLSREIYLAQQEPKSVISRQALTTLEKLSIERDALAAYIYNHAALYSQALDFYQIGMAKPGLGFEKPSEQALQNATRRWYRLQQQAAQHVIRQRVQAYNTALLANQVEERQALAHTIMGDTKMHHGAIMAFSLAPAETWRAIRQDAKAYEENQWIAQLSTQQRADLHAVNAYRQARRAAGQAWREIFESKSTLHLKLENNLDPAVAIAKAQALMRDNLAATIYQDIPRYQFALDYFQMTVVDINKAAEAQHGRDRIKTYGTLLTSSPSAVIERAMLAQRICEDAKAHHGAVVEAGLNWKAIYRDAKIAERHDAFIILFTEEKQALRLVERYQQVNRQAGRAWAVLRGYREFKQCILPKREQAAYALSAKRDALAARIYQKLSLCAPFCHDKKMDLIKLQQQAERHARKIETVQTWQVAREQGKTVLTHITYQTGISDEAKLSSYIDWLSLQQDCQRLAKPILRQEASYRSALAVLQIRPQQLLKDAVNLRQLENAVFKLLDVNQQAIHAKAMTAWDESQRHRIAKARQIERESLTIRGTLAERYLREHRGITGKLPKHFRYHPKAIYYHTDKATGEITHQAYYPALVTVAKDRQQKTLAVQVIYLDPKTANKITAQQHEIGKRTYGVIRGGAAVLVNQGRHNDRIAIAEGPETALSIAEARPDLTVYATLSSSNFKYVPIPEGTKEVIFCADNDGKNQAAQKKIHDLAPALANRGISVWQVIPKTAGHDFNDVLKEQGRAAVKAYLNQPVLIKAAQTEEMLQTTVQMAVENLLDASHPSTEEIKLTASLVSPEIETALSRLLGQEIELAELVIARDIHRVNNPSLASEYSQKAKALDKSIKEYAAEIIHNTELQKILRDTKANIRNSINDLGGFEKLKKQFDERVYTRQEIAVLARHAQRRALQDTARARTQDKGRRH